MVNSYHDY